MRFISGPDPRAILDHCLKEIAQFTRDFPGRRAFLLVPENLKAESERRYLEKFEPSGLMMAEVLSLRRFGERVFQVAGGLPGRLLSPSGKRLLIRQILRRDQANYPQLYRLSTRLGALDDLTSVLGDFARQGLAVGDLDLVAQAYPGLAGRRNLIEFARLQSDYQEALDRLDLADPVQALTWLTDLVQSPDPFCRARTQFIGQSEFWLAGYGDLRQLTKQEARFVAALWERGAGLNLGLVQSSDPSDFGTSSLSEASSRRLLALLPEAAGQELERIVVADRRQSQAVDLARFLLGRSLKKPRLTAFQARLFHAENKYLAAEYLAGEIKRLLLTEGVRRKQIVVGLAEPGDEVLLRRVFHSYDLEPDLDHPLRLEESALYQYLAGLFSLAKGQRQTRQVLDLMRNCLRPAGLDLDQVDRLENLALARAWTYWSSLEWELPQLAAEYQGSEFPRDLIEAQILISAYLEAVSSLPSQASGGQYLTTLCHLLEADFGPFGPLQELLADQAKSDPNLAALTAVSWQSLTRLLEEVQALFADQEFSLEDFSDLVLTGLAETAPPRIPLGLDRISVGSLQQVLHKDCDYLFIFNSKASNLPPALPGEGLLKSDQRAFLSRAFAGSFPDRQADYLAGNRYLLSQLFALPKKGLAFVHCDLIRPKPRYYTGLASWLKRLISKGGLRVRRDLGFRFRRRPRALESDSLSRYELKLARAYPGLLKGIEAGDIPDQRALSAGSLERTLRLYGGNYEPAIREAWGQLELKDLGSDPLLAARPEIRLPEILLPQLIERIGTMSVSRLERLAACPYQAFVGDILQAKERLEIRPDPRQRGSFIHRVLELAQPHFGQLLDLVKELTKGQVSPLDQVKYLAREVLPELYQKVAIEQGRGLWLDPEVFANEGRRLRALLAGSLYELVTELGQSGYQAREAEWRFPAGDLAVKLDFGLAGVGGQVGLRGLIDRIDFAPEGDRIRLLDYKTGAKKVDLGRIYAGLDLQLPLYIHVLDRVYTRAVVDQAGLYRLRTERTPARKLGREEAGARPKYLATSFLPDRQSCQAAQAIGVRRAGEVLTRFFAGQISPRPRVLADRAGSFDQAPCHYCNYRAICAFDRKTLASRLELRAVPEDLQTSAGSKQREIFQAEVEAYLDRGDQDGD